MLKSLYNKTISETCESEKLSRAIIDSKSIETLKTFLNKYSTTDYHLFSFWLTNQTKVFYQYDFISQTLSEKSGTIIKKSFVSCFDQEFTTIQKIGIFLGIIFAVAIVICTVMYIISRRNKTVSFRIHLLNIYLIKPDIEKINI